MKATEQYFPVVLFIMLFKVVLNFECMDEFLKCDLSNESYWAVPSRGTVYYAVQGAWFQLLSVWVRFYRLRLLSSTPVSFYAVEMKSFSKFDIARILNSLQGGPSYLDLFTWLSNFLPFVISF